MFHLNLLKMGGGYNQHARLDYWSATWHGSSVIGDMRRIIGTGDFDQGQWRLARGWRLTRQGQQCKKQSKRDTSIFIVHFHLLSKSPFHLTLSSGTIANDIRSPSSSPVPTATGDAQRTGNGIQHPHRIQSRTPSPSLVR